MATRFSLLMPAVIPLLASPGVSALVEPALCLVLAARQASLRHGFDPEADTDAPLQNVGEPVLPLLHLLLRARILGHDAYRRDIGGALVGGQHDLVFVDRWIGEHHVVDSLRPDIDALDLLHV